jgi:hypothetical protein
MVSSGSDSTNNLPTLDSCAQRGATAADADSAHHCLPGTNH